MSLDNSTVINLCRPKSAMRFNEAPDFQVNGTTVGAITNGSKNVFIIKPGDKFRVYLPKNFLLQRYSDSLIFEATAEKPGHLYMMLANNLKPDFEAGIDTIFFGSIIAATGQKMREPNQIWFVNQLSENNFESQCSR